LATGEEQLEDVVRLLEEFSVDGSDRTSEESHSWKDGSSEMKQRRDDHRSQLEAELLRVTDLSEDVFSNMETEYARQMASAKDTISNIQHALSKMTQTINHLHLSFSSTSRDADDLSKIIEGQAARILLLQNLVSDLRECNKPPLERRLKDQVSQIKLVAEWTGRARVDDQKRERPGQQLSEDLKSLQQELDASSAQAKAYARSVSGLSNEVSDLQGQCRSCEQRVDGLRRELDKAIALTRDFERRGRKMMRDDAQREQVALMDEWKKLRHQLGNMRRMDKDKVAVIRRQLERPHRISKYRNDRIQHLVKETRTQLLDCLDHLQASVRERGLKIGYLEWKSSGIEGQTDQLESRLGDLDLALDNHKWGAFKFCEVTLVTGHIRRLHDQAADIELAFERALY
jgi:chromosome segregation ATPase